MVNDANTNRIDGKILCDDRILIKL